MSNNASGSFRVRLMLFTLLGLFTSAGSSCPHMLTQMRAMPPALTTQPTLQEVTKICNENTNRIENLTASDMTITAGLFSLKANLSFERPRNLRLVAQTTLTGTEIDAGSNDEVFWVWTKRAPQPTIFFCRHEEFPASPARQMLPIEPDWLVEALGLVKFDDTAYHDGPHVKPGNRLEVYTFLPGIDGRPGRSKITVLDARRGWVLEQHVFDERRQRVASASLSKHRIDPLTSAVLPTEIDVECPAAELTMHVAVREWNINLPENIRPRPWQMPNDPSWQRVNLARPNASLQGQR